MVQTRRQKQREATYAEIKQVARQQMSEQGTAGINLRTIAAEMGLTPPALYRYYDSRSSLITALVADGFQAVGDAIQAGCDSRPADDHAGRFYAAALAYRGWALENPTDFALIFGQPIPGYEAPAEVTVPLVRRAFQPFLVEMETAWRKGQITLPPEYQQPPADVAEHLAEWVKRANLDINIPVLYFTQAKFGTIHGLVVTELYNLITPVLGNMSSTYRLEVRNILATLSLHVGDDLA